MDKSLSSTRKLLVAGALTAVAGLALAVAIFLVGANAVPEGEDRWWFAFRVIGEVAFVVGVVVAVVALAIGRRRRAFAKGR